MLQFISQNRSRLAVTGLFVLVAALTFALQSYNVGFWALRHGWTSVHGLAIMSRAEPANGLVGYSMEWVEEDGTPHYEYFDRYPPFFSAAANRVMALTDDLPTEIYLMRLFMDVVFILTMIAAYRLARIFLDNRFLAFAAVTTAFSSYYLLYYKDMVHYHQPATFSFMALAVSIAHYKLNGARRQLYMVAALAVLLAFGYATLFMVLVWLLVDAARTLADGTRSWRGRLVGLLRLDALWVLVMGVALTVLAIGYNVWTEARLRGVPITETSVVDSMLRRLPFVENVVADVARDQAATSEGISGWLQFFVVQFERVARWSLPLRTPGETGTRFVPGETPMMVSGWVLAVGLVMVGVVVWFCVRQRGPRRDIALIVAFGAWPLLFGLINLTSVHDYATMFGIGFSVVLWTALFKGVPRRPALVTVGVLASLTVFAVSNWMVRQDQQIEVQQGAAYTYDFNRIRAALPNDGVTIYLDYNSRCIIRNWQCYALGYYLTGHALTRDNTQADYVLSPRPYYVEPPFVAAGESVSVIPRPLTPENTLTYLLDKAQTVPRTAPDDPTPLFRFGDALTIQEWTLIGDVNVPPCGMVSIESWWLAESPPATNNNMQIVMVAPDGGAVTEANRPLGSVPTEIWETDAFTLDVRYLRVPCDTPPGEYPLIMGVYDPSTLTPFPVSNADGSPVGNQLYLTTLFVN